MSMTQSTGQLSPDSLVARIIAELEANPAAQHLLLRALLTNEFLGMPARLDAIEADIKEMKIDIERLKSDTEIMKGDIAELKTDVSVLKEDVAVLKEDVAELKTDVAQLKVDVVEIRNDIAILKTDVARLNGDSLENKLSRWIMPFLSQKLRMRRPRIVQSPLFYDTEFDLREVIADAVEAGSITDEDEIRILETDLILNARRKSDRSAAWLAVEASGTINESDFDRARWSANVLGAVFDVASIPVVMGYDIRPEDHRRAVDQGLEIFILEPYR